MEGIEIFIITGICLTLLFAAFIIAFLLINQKRHYKYIREKEKIKNEFEQTLLQSQLEIKEQTLRHIAYELHDNLGQIASLIKINLNTLQLGEPEKSIQKIEETKELTRRLIGDLKSLSISLNSDRVSQLGLVKGLKEEIERLNRTGLFHAELSVSESVPPLSENATIILYRMAQEILNNIVKHSQATEVSISIQVVEKLFTLVIRDNGVGFTLNDNVNGGGSGLLNLQSRAKLIEAVLSIESSPGAGTRISIDLPLHTHDSTPRH